MCRIKISSQLSLFVYVIVDVATRIQEKPVSTGVIATIVVCSVLFIIIVLVAAFCYKRKLDEKYAPYLKPNRYFQVMLYAFLYDCQRLNLSLKFDFRVVSFSEKKGIPLFTKNASLNWNQPFRMSDFSVCNIPPSWEISLAGNQP